MWQIKAQSHVLERILNSSNKKYLQHTLASMTIHDLTNMKNLNVMKKMWQSR
jgi:hypothetical protein